ncbi:uncharacterized protein LOC114575856 [Exaiptasia diaphana]|uniref:C2H2-type domain-containing protein n=1 Tax=Exaiptasia diaphana TaxID=2652724 RepID=A0A913YQ60_EXADI|nr:uncharacterized protein LOC114575856 [Exaiptasia diaphana]
MEACCSFKSIVGSGCGFDTKDRKQRTEIVALHSCCKDISKHLATLSFSGPENEIELILSRAGLYDTSEEKVRSMTICPRHRATLGIGWTRGGGTRCRVPQQISGHGKSKGSWPKGDRGIGNQESYIILQNTGLLVPPGSGICKTCRVAIKEMPKDSKSDVKHVAERIQELTLHDEAVSTESETFMQTPKVTPLKPETPLSMYTLPQSETEDKTELTDTRQLLNNFLKAREVSPIRHQLTTPWDDVSKRTKRRYVHKAKRVVLTALEELAPSGSKALLSAVRASSDEEDYYVDKSLMEALVECYNNAGDWSTRRQILSIMADKLPYLSLKKWIPGLSRYRFSVARHHILLHGRGSVVPTTKSPRMYVSPQKLDHFLTFITSGHVIQDLPFGEKTLKLSSGAEVVVPNVVHVSKSSRVPDHCRQHALSQEGSQEFSSECDHQHDQVCENCELLPLVFSQLDTALSDIPNSDEKKDMEYIINQGKKDIQAWKAHLLRAINQDECRIDILQALDPSSVLIVLDWAMKWIPKKYRESQSDWYGKKGVSWHIAVAITRNENGTLEMLTFVHVFTTCSQDSYAVMAIINDVVGQLKAERPQLSNFSLRQDNAGCYHSAFNLKGLKEVAKLHKINLRVDYSDPQGGKGSCDRKAANIKGHIKAYVNSGKDVENTLQMKKAIESSKGVQGVRVMLCEPPEMPRHDPLKWEGVSVINDITYKENGVEVWREYGIGKGKTIQWSEFTAPKKIPLPTMTISETAVLPKATFEEVSVRKRKASTSTAATSLTEDESSEDEDEQVPKLFPCTNDGCIRSFQRFSSLQRHLDIDKHKYALERETFLDKAMLSYAGKLHKGDDPLKECTSDEEGAVTRTLTYSESLPMGWALKSSTVKRKQFSDGQRNYLIKMFDVGEQTGHKVDPNTVSQSMRKARNADGSSIFDSSEYLTAKQIKSFFSRLAKKRREAIPDDSTDDETEYDIQSRVNEQDLQDLTDSVMNEVRLIHPILFESHNLCDLAKNLKLNTFSIKMLADVCAFFGLDTTSLRKRKKAYIDLLYNEVLHHCNCM